MKSFDFVRACQNISKLSSFQTLHICPTASASATRLTPSSSDVQHSPVVAQPHQIKQNQQRQHNEDTTAVLIYSAVQSLNLPQPSHVVDVLSVWVAGAKASTVASPPSFVMIASDAASARGSWAPICK
jgi:hypothetical protein